VKALSFEGFVNLMEEKKYRISVEGELNIIGYRNRFGRANYFDDVISVYQNKATGWKEWHYEATTLPGTPSLLKPVNSKGAAILVPGQYINAYAIGFHRNKYKALIQVKPVRVYRDRDKDGVLDIDEASIETGLFGINIHRASLNNLIVGPDSAGCQVIHKRTDYNEFISLCDATKEQKNRFTYTLVDL
jgi:hypothetical protein